MSSAPATDKTSSRGPCTTWSGGTLRVTNTPPATMLPRPITVSPPRIVAPA
jgi:hypothetical protein